MGLQDYIQTVHDAALAGGNTPAEVRALTAAQVATICEVTPPEPGFFPQPIRSRAAAKLGRTLRRQLGESRRDQAQATLRAALPDYVAAEIDFVDKGATVTVEGPAFVIRRDPNG